MIHGHTRCDNKGTKNNRTCHTSVLFWVRLMLGVLHQCRYLLGPYYLWMVHVHMHGFSRETGAVCSTVSLSPDGRATGLYALCVLVVVVQLVKVRSWFLPRPSLNMSAWNILSWQLLLKWNIAWFSDSNVVCKSINKRHQVWSVSIWNMSQLCTHSDCI